MMNRQVVMGVVLALALMGAGKSIHTAFQAKAELQYVHAELNKTQAELKAAQTDMQNFLRWALNVQGQLKALTPPPKK
jgi:type II secretory pathway pseudopilin PulG